MPHIFIKTFVIHSSQCSVALHYIEFFILHRLFERIRSSPAFRELVLTRHLTEYSCLLRPTLLSCPSPILTILSLVKFHCFSYLISEVNLCRLIYQDCSTQRYWTLVKYCWLTEDWSVYHCPLPRLYFCIYLVILSHPKGKLCNQLFSIQSKKIN